MGLKEKDRPAAPTDNLSGIACLCKLFVLLQVLVGGFSTTVYAADEPLMVEVSEPYLELHVGPGDDYSVFHVVDRGGKVEILKRRTGWFRVRTAKGREGWVSRKQIEATLLAPGIKFSIEESSKENYFSRDWETGVLAGNFEGSNSITLYTDYAFNPNLSA